MLCISYDLLSALLVLENECGCIMIDPEGLSCSCIPMSDPGTCSVISHDTQMMEHHLMVSCDINECVSMISNDGRTLDVKYHVLWT